MTSFIMPVISACTFKCNKYYGTDIAEIMFYRTRFFFIIALNKITIFVFILRIHFYVYSEINLMYWLNCILNIFAEFKVFS